MKQKFNLGEFLTKNLMILIVLIVFIFWWSGCGGKEAFTKTGKTISDTTSKTTQVLQPIVIGPTYTPQQNGQPVYVNLPANAQGVIPAKTLDSLVAQVIDLSNRIEALGKQYYSVKAYKDSFKLKDTSGLEVGTVTLDQGVTQNTLTYTTPRYQLKFPHTTTTITNTVYPKPKTQVYVGVGVESMINNPNIQQIDLGFMLKNKKDNVIGLSGVYDLPSKQTGIRVSYFQKIQFKLF